MATKDISVIRDKKTGDIKNIRDKEIKDAKAKTAVAQTDAVRMKTVDDKEVYIDRNSLVQAIAEVMNSNSQSTIQTLFGADANGNHANINMANLASVLSDSLHISYPNVGTHTTNDGVAIWSYLGNVVLTLKRLDAGYGCDISYENSNGSLGRAGYDYEGSFEILPTTNNNLVLKLKREGIYGCAIDFQNSSGRIGLLEAKEDGHLYWKNELIK